MSESAPNPLLEVGLPKWPEIRVSGSPVTKEQAAIMAVRLTGTYFSTNEDPTNRMISRCIYNHDPKRNTRGSGGIAEQAWEHYAGEALAKNFSARWAFENAVYAHYGIIRIDNLQAHYIASSWIGGPHGWFRLDGTVQNPHAYNIGKWPDAGSVFQEWAIVAKAFPFLDLTCQLFNGEECENGAPVVQFRVKGGIVVAEAPGEPLAQGSQPDISALFSGARRETAFTERSLNKALELTTESLGRPRFPDFADLVQEALSGEGSPA